ncbi:heme lyase CcmF/NrfE family subunit [Candidatus Magnetaquicoccus inordinatus]|uniref:heme lyase CcmF/NrfE family subunit n=1 Tax=Candidatus Magnetaquicoccus inordinatus TaxID=2496818 RepID=UPI00102B92DD|nr:heme lyase CcmF/NrfE family subunit [Candidatus Magnetaquicoccus inordinatus]
MWIELGHFAAILAFLLTLTQTSTTLFGIYRAQPVWIRVAKQANMATLLLLTLSGATLINAFLQHDFSVRYVASHSSLELPIFYLATALWGGHEGSLLLWAWLLSLFNTIAIWRHWSTHSRSIPWVMAILGALLAGFLILILFLSSPFERLIPAPGNGRDLNPMLQDPGMVFHPPFLYMGYVGFSIPYAFAMAALITGQASDEWILATRRWSLFAWLTLTIGIVFGAYWAYYVLGWGGYWAWDPVENASFMPWLTATAFLHSVMVQERRGMFKTWNLFLIITTFALSLLGTFLVRSGVLSSVHAFASDPGRGVYILLFMSILLLFSFGMLALRAELLRNPIQLESLLSKESAFLFNNLLLVVAALTVLLGTLYPLAVETLSSAKVSVGAPYYNKVFIPIMLGILLLMGIAPMIHWRRAILSRLKQDLPIPILLALLALLLAPLFAITHPYGIATATLMFFVLGSHLLDLFRGVQARRAAAQKETPPRTLPPWSALQQLLTRNKRRYGGLLVHLGIITMCAGFIGSGLFQQELDLTLSPGDSVQLGNWTVTLDSIGPAAKYNWTAVEATFRAQQGQTTVVLKTQKRTYSKHSQPITEAAIHTTWREDLYIVLGDLAKENTWNFRIYRNPLVVWLWWGTGLMVLGVTFAMLQGRRPS